jgi:putative aldouronate transport system substrate-binding protein
MDLMPILCGFVSYDEAFPAVEKKLKDAGIDKVVAEVQRQLDEYFKKIGK